MGSTVQNDQVLQRLRSKLGGIFGNRLDKIILYGSRARGEAVEESDYDVAVFLNDYTDRFAKFAKIDPIQADIWAETGALISPLVFRATDYTKQTGLMHNIRTDGVAL